MAESNSESKKSGNHRFPLFSYYAVETAPIYLSVFLMRFSFAFTVVALQWLVPIQIDRGIISSAYPIMELATGFFLGVLADKIGRKWIIVGALLASSFVTLSFTFTRSILLLVMIHGLQGICAAAIITSTLALLTDYARRKTRGREMGIYDFSTIAGYALGFVFALILIGGNPAKSLLPFYAGSIVALGGAAISAVSLRNPKISFSSARVSVRENIGRVASDRLALTLIPAWFVLMIVIGVGLTYTREIVGALVPGGAFGLFGGAVSVSSSPAQGRHTGIIGLIAFLLGAILLGFTQSSFGSLSDKFGRARIIVVGETSILGFLLVLIGLLYFDMNRFIALGLIVIFGAGLLAFTPAALAQLADVAPESGRGSAMGLYSVTVGAGTIFGPLVGGALISTYGIHVGLSILFAFGAVLMIFVLIPPIIAVFHRK